MVAHPSGLESGILAIVRKDEEARAFGVGDHILREDVDIGIRFGTGHYPGLHVVPMFKPREIVVCSPELLKRGPPLKTFADLKNHTLLHDDSHRAWIRWLDAAGVKGVNPRRGIICGDRNSMLQATLAGQGVGIASEVFAAPDLIAGRLVKLFGVEIASEFAVAWCAVVARGPEWKRIGEFGPGLDRPQPGAVKPRGDPRGRAEGMAEGGRRLPCRAGRASHAPR